MPALPRSNLWLSVWWLAWGAILYQQLYVRIFGPSRSLLFSGNHFNAGIFAFLLCPLCIGCVVRWVVLPKVTTPVWGFFFFILGLILAAMTGLAFLFMEVLGGAILSWVCIIGILQFAPIRRKEAEPISAANPPTGG